MKKSYILLSAVLLAVACTTGINDNMLSDTQTRTLTVRSAETRTTIEYEGSDVSHLVWRDGDKVAYCTDVASDTFKTAEVTSNSFKAEVPEEAESIIVVYPAGENEGKSLAQATASLSAETVHDVDTAFDGSLLPMSAIAPIPADTDEVNVVYECLASIVRFTVLPSTDEQDEVVESVKAVTLSANEAMTGSFAMGATGSLEFTGNGNSVTVNVTGTPENLLLNNSPVCYAVVNRAAYSGVKVIVETDLATYEFKDGIMDVSHPERTLYRVDLDLSTVTPVDGEPQQEPYFSAVTSIDEITAEGTYLIVADKDETAYYVTDKTVTGSYYLNGMEFAADENGIKAEGDIMSYTWQITKDDVGYVFFGPDLMKGSETGHHLAAAGGSGYFNGTSHEKVGKTWYQTETQVSALDVTRWHWDIEMTPDGFAKVKSLYDRQMEDGSACYYKYNTERSQFILCFEGVPGEMDIRILKLTTAM